MSFDASNLKNEDTIPDGENTRKTYHLLPFFFFGGSEKWIALPGSHSLSVKDGHGKFLEIQINKGVIFDLPQYLSHVRKAMITLWDGL